MKEIKISKKVYEKDFKVKALGYCCEEVDRFLDEINEEIVKLERKLEDAIKEKDALEAKYMASEQKAKQLSVDLLTAKAQSTVTSSSNANFSNIDVLNRIGHLEKMIQALLDKEK